MIAETISIASLSPDPANARKHGPRNLDTIVASLRRFGQVKPIVIDSKGIVRAGNGTLEAAKQLGWTEIEAITTTLEGVEAAAYAIADNRTSELAEWDEEVLTQLIEGMDFDGELSEAIGFTTDELEAMVEGLDLSLGEVTEDEVPEPPEEPITQTGDLWILGEHRVLCGDSTKAEDVERLMDGATINIAFTSPPYASQRKYDESSGFKPIHPNEYVGWWEPTQANIAAHLAVDGSMFVNIKEHCEDGQRVLYVKDLTIAHVREWGWRFVDELCWIHEGIPGRWANRFKNRFEPVFHFVKSMSIKLRHESVMHTSDRAGRSNGSNSKTSQGNVGFNGDVGEGLALPGNVIQINHGSGRDDTAKHPAKFPIALPTFFIKAYTDEGDVIYDPFLGSGTTLIAAEQLGRKCYGMEISPAYCDVIVNRWENLTGQKAERWASEPTSV